MDTQPRTNFVILLDTISYRFITNGIGFAAINYMGYFIFTKMRKCKGHPKGFVLVRDRLKKNVTIIIKGGAMKTKEGDIFKRDLDGEEYTIIRIVNRMVVLESRDGKRQVLTEIDNLQLKSFYQKRGDVVAFGS
jgi:hypothetical protein